MQKETYEALKDIVNSLSDIRDVIKWIEKVEKDYQEEKPICTFNACKNKQWKYGDGDLCKKHYLQGINK